MLNQDVHNYIQAQINPFIEPLVCELVMNRPSSPISYAIDWLTALFHKQNCKAIAQIASDSEEECQDEVRDLERKIAQNKASSNYRKARNGVSEQVFGDFNFKEDILLSGGNLNDDEKLMVKSILHSSILFQKISSLDEEIFLKAISKKQTEEDELIIRQGEDGDTFYLVESGEYDCYKLTGNQNNFVKTYIQGQTFGELALMYNSSRTSSIVTKQSGILLTLDRNTFSKVMKLSAIRKQQIVMRAIEHLQFFKTDPTQLVHQLINILKEEKFAKGDYIIMEGEVATKFYIVLEGMLIAEKADDQLSQKDVFSYVEGDYFGQLNLANDNKRYASVKAMTACKLAVVSGLDFKRVFGDFQQILTKQWQRKLDD